MTVKAVRVLHEADVVFVPVSGGGEPGYAEGVVRAHTDRRIERLEFALGDPTGREQSWEAAAGTVHEAVAGGAWAAFATIGDPNLYSTFTYLVRCLPPNDVTVDTVPGITAMQDLAARSGTVLAEGAQTVALLPFTAGPGRLGAALKDHDVVVLYKGGRFAPEMRALLAAAGRLDDAVFGAKLGLDGETVGPVPKEPAPYLSTVIVRPPHGW
jgi:precorrin-2/cobalt-factor-2 C20-methyltransferase